MIRSIKLMLLAQIFFCFVNAYSQKISINKSSLLFNCIQQGSLPLSQSIIISNAGAGELIWEISEDIAWLEVNPRIGKDSGIVQVSIITSNIAPGQYAENITVLSPNANNSPIRISVTLIVSKKPAINLSKKDLSFYAFQNSELPKPDTIFISNSGNGSFNWSAIGNVSWISLNPLQGKDSAFLAVRINNTNMNTGIYDGLINIISGEAQNSPQTLNIKYYLNPQYQSSLTLNKIFDFPVFPNAENYKPSNYKLIGLPGNSRLPLKNLFTGEQGVDWQAFRDNGRDTNYFIENDNSEDFKFTTGKGFWIIKRSPLNINTTVNSSPINTTHRTEIPLNCGWNIITNPFLTDLSWSIVKDLNKIKDPIWKYSGKFETSLLLDAYEGYYFDNRDSLKSLLIPWGNIHNNLKKNTDIQTEWAIEINLENHKRSFGNIKSGIIKDSEKGIDKYDLRKPRSLFEEPSIYFDRAEWDKRFKYMATDIRPIFSVAENWEFTLDNLEINSIYSLRFVIQGILPSFYNVWLNDIEQETRIDLKKYSIYYFTPDKKSLKFHLTVSGNSNNKEINKEYKPPANYRIMNYPNPFNNSTYLMLEIPLFSKIDLHIYDILGRRVAFIFSDFLFPGTYRFLWDGKDNNGIMRSGGIYFYRLIINNNSFISGRMILLK